MGFAMAATLYEPAFAVVVSWFARGRDRALLTVTLVAGLASTIFMPIEAALLERMGWRSALTVLAVVLEIGRASCRGRGEISVVAGSLKKKSRRRRALHGARGDQRLRD